MTERIEASTRQLEAEIVEHQQTGTALRESEQRFRDLFERSPDPSWLIHDHQFEDCNLAAVKLLGYASRNELLATHPSKLSPEIQPDGQSSFDKAEEMMRTALEQGIHRFEWEHRRADGTCFPVEVTLARLNLQGQENLYCVWRDITERKLLEDQVREMAFHDSLTGLPNRRLLNDRLAQAMATSRRSGCHGAVMLLDLDNFKPLNDHHGHGVGDLLLIEVAQRLRACVRKIDTVSRFGGDEFVVLVSELDIDRQQSATQAAVVAEKIRRSLGRSYLLALRPDAGAEQIVEHRCTASIGVALFYDDTTDQDDILKAADTAMYLAKEAGRNQIRFSEASG
jgi:diguanylate cyclase (GGDEF)-like protein/PAS domain S-box-containing protein